MRAVDNKEKIEKEQAEKDAERADELSHDAETKEDNSSADPDVAVENDIKTEQLLLDIKELLLSMRDVIVSNETAEPETETEKVEELGTTEAMGNADEVEKILGL